MTQYALRRLMGMGPVLLMVSIAVFLIIHLIPGDPAQLMAGSNATLEQMDALRRQMGLDQPLPIQYLVWLRNVATGNMGVSLVNGLPVNTTIAQRVPATLELALAAAIIAVVIAFPLGILGAVRQGSLIDFVGTMFSALSFAVPGFWLAILLVLFFSVQFQLLPASGRPDIFEEPVEHFKALLLPAFTLGVAMAAKLSRYLRSSMLGVLQQDYIRAARAKGLHERMVVLRHALRNALIPVITMFALQAGDLLSGSIIVESIFAWPGVGRTTIQALGLRDYALLQANVLYIVVAFLFLSLVADLAYGYVDPRVRYG